MVCVPELGARVLEEIKSQYPEGPKRGTQEKALCTGIATVGASPSSGGWLNNIHTVYSQGTRISRTLPTDFLLIWEDGGPHKARWTCIKSRVCLYPEVTCD